MFFYVKIQSGVVFVGQVYPGQHVLQLAGDGLARDHNEV